MAEMLTLQIDGRSVCVHEGASVAAAILMHGGFCRTSVHGQPRSVLCGMGICFECRATVNGVAQQRTCQLICRQGMQVVTLA